MKQNYQVLVLQEEALQLPMAYQHWEKIQTCTNVSLNKFRRQRLNNLPPTPAIDQFPEVMPIGWVPMEYQSVIAGEP